MKRLLIVIGRWFGFYFAPDNHVLPVLRLGRFRCVKDAGIRWIIPVLEQALPPVKTSLHVGNFLFEQVMSRDNIPFEIQMTVLFTFKPAAARQEALAVLTRGGSGLFLTIVKDYASQGVRRLAARFDAEELSGQLAMSSIERDLTRFLRLEMAGLGLAPLPSGGILIKETVPPEKFKRGIQNARRLEAIMQALSRYPVGDLLIQQAIQAGFVTGLEDLEGDLGLFLSNLPPVEGAYQPYLPGLHNIPAKNGRSNWGRH